MIDSGEFSQARSYRLEVRIGQPPDTVFDALSTLDGLGSWWSPVAGSPASGGELRFFHRHEDPLVIHVETAERPRFVAWTVLAYPLNPEWVGTRITFRLTPEASDASHLEFCHEGLIPQLECYEHCRRGWNHFLPSLRSYVETGRGSPIG